MAGIRASARDNWTTANNVLAMGAALALVGAIGVFVFGVVWTHGVYGSRMAWLVGVVLPLLAVAAGLALAAARHGVIADSGHTEGVQSGRSDGGHRDRRGALKVVGVTSLVLFGVPFALAGLLLLTYGLLFVRHWFR